MTTCKDCTHHDLCDAKGHLLLTINDICELEYRTDVSEWWCKNFKPAADVAPKSEWISVGERLPEPFVSVLTYMPGEAPHPTVHEGYLNKRGKWYAGGFDRLPDEVVMWMPMPEPPMMKGE